MEALSTVFDAVACIGDVLGRGEAKAQELEALLNTAESIASSVQVYTAALDQKEQEELFYSNKVFQQMSEHLGLCHDLIFKRLESASDSKSAGDSGVLALLKNGAVARTRTTLREGLEAVGGKLGANLSSVFQLPEDELQTLRRHHMELQRLVPLLTLAVTTHKAMRKERGYKRSALPGALEDEPRARAARLEVSVAPRPPATAATAALHHGVGSGECELPGGSPTTRRSDSHLPVLQLQLISHAPQAASCDLPSLATDTLRAVSGSSTTSLDNINGTTKIFGRQELKDQLPRCLTLPDPLGRGEPQSLSRFVSRDVFELEVLPDPQAAGTSATPESLDMATLPMMAGAYGDGDDTLAMEPCAPEAPVGSLPLAMVRGLSGAGLHVQASSETKWRFVQKDQRAALRDGDRIALLLECPLGSGTPGPQRDLQPEEAACLLGVQVQAGMLLADKSVPLA